MILSRDEEIQLIKSIKNRKKHAENQLIKKYNDFFYRIIQKRIKDKDICKDILNDTFISSLNYTKSCTYDGKRARIQTYLTKIIRNKISNYFKEKSNRSLEIGQFPESNPDSVSNPNPDPVKILILNEEKDYLKKAFSSLDEPCKKIIKLKIYEGKTYKEISKILNIPVNTVGSRLHYSLKKLKFQFFYFYEGN